MSLKTPLHLLLQFKDVAKDHTKESMSLVIRKNTEIARFWYWLALFDYIRPYEWWSDNRDYDDAENRVIDFYPALTKSFSLCIADIVFTQKAIDWINRNGDKK